MRCCTKWMVSLMVVAACLCIALPVAGAAKAKAQTAAPAAEGPKPASLDEAFKQLAAYEFGQSREALTMINDAVRDSYKNAPERAKLLARFTAMLSDPKVTLDGKRFVCRQLSIAGTAESVPPIAALLLDKDLSDMARYALERIPDPAALAAMRTALGKAADPKQKIGLMNSLAVRRDAESLPAIAAALKTADPAVASAAAAALGKIDGSEAVVALNAALASAKPEVKSTIADSLLLCADNLAKTGKKDEASAIYQQMYKPAEAKHVRMAALRGLISVGGDKALPLLTEVLSGTDSDMQAAALRFLREVSGPDSAKTVAALLPKSPVAAQALLLDDLATRGDASTLPAVVAMAKSPDAGVRLAAIRAIGKLGDASTLPLLAPLAAGPAGPGQEEARRALDRLPGGDVNNAILAMAEKGDPKVRAEMIRALGARRVSAAVPVALKAAEDADAAVRTAALDAVDILADEKSAPAIVALVVKAKTDAERQAAEKALGDVCGRAANKDACIGPMLAAVGTADLPAKCALIRVLGRAGGPKALAAVRGFVKDSNPEIQDAAVRSLAEWSDASAAPDLLALAKGEGKAAVLAQRGYIRLAGLPDVPEAQKIAMYKNALAVAKRPEEKRQALGGLGDLKSVEALRMVIPMLDDPALAAEAAVSAVSIAKAVGVGAAKDEIKAAMPKVLAATKDAAVKKDAQDLLKQAGGTVPAPAKPGKKTMKAPLVSVYHAAAGGKKGGAKAEAKKETAAPEPVDLSKVEKVDLAPAEEIGWYLAIQAYTFRAVSLFEAMDRAAAIGIKYVEMFPSQKLSPERPDVKSGPGMSDEDIAALKQKAASLGMKIVNIGVIGLGSDEASARKVFDFAKKLGIETIVCEAPETMFGLLDKLTEEYKINISLHNHPKPSHYWDADTVLKGVEGHSKRIGSCSDTGHWMRSALDPLECLKKLQGRIIGIHFKDLNAMGGGAEKPHDVPWGTGVGNAKALLAEIYRQGFKGVFSIEYESGSGQELIDNVDKCAQFFAATAAELGKGK